MFTIVSNVLISLFKPENIFFRGTKVLIIIIIFFCSEREPYKYVAHNKDFLGYKWFNAKEKQQQQQQKQQN